MPPLTPNQLFNIVYQLGSPGDTGTYFVQAIVRYSSTGAIVATINLANQGNQRFTGTFMVPSDTQGNGYYLDITYTVYTDAFYSVLSQNYAIQNVVAQVLQQITLGMGIGGGDGISEIELRKILELYFGNLDTKILSAKEMANMDKKEFDWSPMDDRMSDITTQLSSLSDHSEKINAIMNAINRVHDVTKAIPTETKETDLTPLTRMMKVLDYSISDAVNEMREMKEKGSFNRDEMTKMLKEASDKIMSSLFEKIEKMVEEKMESAPFTNNFSLQVGATRNEKEDGEKKPKYNLSNILPTKSPYAPKKK